MALVAHVTLLALTALVAFVALVALAALARFVAFAASTAETRGDALLKPLQLEIQMLHLFITSFRFVRCCFLSEALFGDIAIPCRNVKFPWSRDRSSAFTSIVVNVWT